jgi:hypothetical protein
VLLERGKLNKHKNFWNYTPMKRRQKIMKKAIFAIAVFIFTASLVDAAEPNKIQQQTARFQIVSVEYNSLDTDREIVKKSVLKIDVLTGETWILSDIIYNSDGKIVVHRGWDELEQHLNANGPTK